MTRLTVFGGAGEIGGNQILLEDGGSSVLLDAGKALGTYSRYFQGFAAPLTARGLHDHLLMGLVPPLQGLYRSDLLPAGWDPWPALAAARRRVRPDAILLSHAHLDHCGILPYVDPDIPVYTSCGTAMVLKHLQDWGNAHLDGEFRYTKRRILKNGAVTVARNPREAELRPRRIQIPSGEPWEAVADLWLEAPDSRPWTAVPPLHSDRAGSMKARWFSVDHSMTGSGAMAVQTEAGWVVYTGDLRRHGRKAHLTAEFIRAAAALEPVLLITEGTHTEGPPSPTEAEVRDRITEAVCRADGLVVANFAARNLDRMITMYEAATAAGRQLLISEREADFLRHQRPMWPELPDPDRDPAICVFYRPRPTDDTWMRFWRGRGRRCLEGCGSDRYLRAHPEEYLVCFGLSDMVELVGMEVGRGGLFIYSNHQAYNAEQEADLSRLQAWAELMDMQMMGISEPGFHSSGHLDGAALCEMIAEIAPRMLMPVHTLTPEFFTQMGGPQRVIVPTVGHSVEL